MKDPRTWTTVDTATALVLLVAVETCVCRFQRIDVGRDDDGNVQGLMPGLPGDHGAECPLQTPGAMDLALSAAAVRAGVAIDPNRF